VKKKKKLKEEDIFPPDFMAEWKQIPTAMFQHRVEHGGLKQTSGQYPSALIWQDWIR